MLTQELDSLLKRLLTTIPLLALGCLIAGTYGMLHNQISYTVSPDYFHEFKYIQFHIDADVHGRLGAALIGWRASWWMGIIIAVLIVPISLIARSIRETADLCIKAYAIVAGIAFGVGLCALLYAYCMFDEVAVVDAGEVVRYGNKISHPVEFMRAGFMHNFSYLGAFIGIVLAVVWQICQLIPSRVRSFLPEETSDSNKR